VRDFRFTENRKIIQCKNALNIPMEMFKGRTATIEFLDMRGVRVKCVSVNKNSFSNNGIVNVNLGSYADRLYLMRIISDDKCVTAMPITVIGR
jgi:hypothetical protein